MEEKKSKLGKPYNSLQLVERNGKKVKFTEIKIIQNKFKGCFYHFSGSALALGNIAIVVNVEWVDGPVTITGKPTTRNFSIFSNSPPRNFHLEPFNERWSSLTKSYRELDSYLMIENNVSSRFSNKKLFEQCILSEQSVSSNNSFGNNPSSIKEFSTFVPR